MHVCMYVRMYVFMYVYISMRLCTYVCMHACVQICIYVCVYIYMCMYICNYMYINYIYMFIYIVYIPMCKRMYVNPDVVYSHPHHPAELDVFANCALSPMSVPRQAERNQVPTWYFNGPPDHALRREILDMRI